MTWAATQAKAKFSEVLDKAEAEGPQLVQRRKQKFYVVTEEGFKTLSLLPKHPKATKPKKSESIAEFFRNSPLRNSGIELERIKLKPRHVNF